MYKTLHPMPLNFLIYEENYIFFFISALLFSYSPPPQLFLWFSPLLYTSTVHIIQRWASILANRSNARHRSNIRAPPPVWESVWPEGAGSDSQLAGVRMSHICPCTPCPPRPGRKVKGRKSSFCPPLTESPPFPPPRGKANIDRHYQAHNQGCESRRQTFSSITRPTFHDI